jgi:hypothetical protein
MADKRSFSNLNPGVNLAFQVESSGTIIFTGPRHTGSDENLFANIQIRKPAKTLNNWTGFYPEEEELVDISRIASPVPSISLVEPFKGSYDFTGESNLFKASGEHQRITHQRNVSLDLMPKRDEYFLQAIEKQGRKTPVLTLKRHINQSLTSIQEEGLGAGTNQSLEADQWNAQQETMEKIQEYVPCRAQVKEEIVIQDAIMKDLNDVVSNEEQREQEERREAQVREIKRAMQVEYEAKLESILNDERLKQLKKENGQEKELETLRRRLAEEERAKKELVDRIAEQEKRKEEELEAQRREQEARARQEEAQRIANRPSAARMNQWNQQHEEILRRDYSEQYERHELLRAYFENEERERASRVEKPAERGTDDQDVKIELETGPDEDGLINEERRRSLEVEARITQRLQKLSEPQIQPVVAGEADQKELRSRERIAEADQEIREKHDRNPFYSQSSMEQKEEMKEEVVRNLGIQRENMGSEETQNEVLGQLKEEFKDVDNMSLDNINERIEELEKDLRFAQGLSSHRTELAKEPNKKQTKRDSNKGATGRSKISMISAVSRKIDQLDQSASSARYKEHHQGSYSKILGKIVKPEDEYHQSKPVMKKKTKYLSK